MMNFAFKGTQFERPGSEYLEGPSAIAYLPRMTLRLPQEYSLKFAKDCCQALEIKAGVVEGTFYDAKRYGRRLLTIPSRDELLSKLLGSLQSPITNLARVLNQIAEKGGAADTAEAPAAEEAAPEAPAAEEAAEAPAAEAEAPVAEQ